MKMGSVAGRMFVGRALVVSSLLGLACGGGSQTTPHSADGSSPVDAATLPVTGRDAAPIVTGVDGGAPPSAFDGGGPATVTPSDAGSVHVSVDAMSAGACGLPPAPADLCAAVPTGKVAPCSTSGGQPSQTGYLEIDRPGSAPIYVCATSWNADPSIGYIFGQPGTFMSDPQSCCGGASSSTAAPTAPDLSIGSVGAPHIPSHLKPPEMQQPGSGPLRHNPFAIAVTDTKSGAAASAAISMWKSWGGDAQPHTAPDGSGPYYFASGVSINYAIVETSAGFPVIVVGPEVSLTPDGLNLLGHPTLGACATGGGAPIALIAGEVDGTTLNNHSGRYDYGPSATAQSLEVAAQVFNCMGIRITATKYYAPKS